MIRLHNFPDAQSGAQQPSSPLTIGIIHFVGIGGIGMSGIAEILHSLGYKVQGSDLADNANVRRLQALGIDIALGHRSENLGEASVVVISSAVKRDNPEVVAAREAHLPVVRRAEMLGELMRLKWSVAVGGTHGKTTTTSLVATLFDAAGLDPTVINGGIINDYGTNARLGTGEWMVVESDESDGSFTKLPATICIVTNMDPEHLDYYKDFDAVRRAYATFVENIPFYGFAVLCLDHPEVQALIGRIEDRRIITYGFSPQADVQAHNVRAGDGGMSFDANFTDSRTGAVHAVSGFHIPVIGRHNVLNALAALTVGWQLGFNERIMRAGLAKFKGVKRRFTRTGTVDGIAIIDDYAHHPVEIATTLKAALEATASTSLRRVSQEQVAPKPDSPRQSGAAAKAGGRRRKGEDARIIAVVQPHRYTRLSSLFKEFCTCFNDADVVIVADVHPAGEQPIEGATKEKLVEGLRQHGHREVHALPSQKDLAPLVAKLARPGDYVICLGAGTISSWAHALPGELEGLLSAEYKKSS